VATAPGAEETAGEASLPTVPTSNTKSKALSRPTSHRSIAKAGSARLQVTGKQRGKKDCNPPYYIDASGIRRIKDECF
jgi:hypothetical protein